MRSWRLTVQVALLGVLAVLAFPTDGSALRAVLITLTANGPSPSVLTIPAGLYPVWQNQDSVTHTVAFANGLCTLQIAPGADANCSGGFSPYYVGDYPYTVDGEVQASVVVVPEGRAVTLSARSHRIGRGARLNLHGKLQIPILSPPAPPAPQPVMVLARPDRDHPFRPIATVRARNHGHMYLLWHLRSRLRRRSIYIAEANSQPAGGQFWRRAWSRPFKVVVRAGR